MPTLVIDTEVVGVPWENIPENLRDYLLGRCRDDGEREQLPNRTALIPGIQQVVAIGIWSVEQDRGIALVDDSPARLTSVAPIGEAEFARVAGSKIYRGPEADILAEFWRRLPARNLRIVSFNGRGFDAGVIMRRCAQLGIRSERNLAPYRYDLSEHTDLLDCLTLQGAERGAYSLSWWCWCFDIPSPKCGISGADVGQLYEEGRVDDIAGYVLGDCRATAELYKRLSPMLSAFRGGAALSCPPPANGRPADPQASLPFREVAGG